MKIKKILSTLFACLMCAFSFVPAFAYTAGVEDIQKETYDDGGIVFEPQKAGSFAAEDINGNGAASQFLTIRNASKYTTYTVSCKISSEEESIKGIKASILGSSQENTECVEISTDAYGKTTQIAKMEPGSIFYVIVACETTDGFTELSSDINWEISYVGVTNKSESTSETAETTAEAEITEITENASGISATAKTSETETTTQTEKSESEDTHAGIKAAVIVCIILVVITGAVIIKKQAIMKKSEVETKKSEPDTKKSEDEEENKEEGENT